MISSAFLNSVAVGAISGGIAKHILSTTTKTAIVVGGIVGVAAYCFANLKVVWTGKSIYGDIPDEL